MPHHFFCYFLLGLLLLSTTKTSSYAVSYDVVKTSSFSLYIIINLFCAKKKEMRKNLHFKSSTR